jgi:hypothetical protein
MENSTRVKYGGRAKGTPNRLSSEARNSLQLVIENEMEKIPDHFNQLEPKDRLELLIKLLPYVIPKMQPDIFYQQQSQTIKKLVFRMPTLTQSDN